MAGGGQGEGGSKGRLVSMSEVAKHSKKEDLWVVIHGHVYDLTNFIDEHPGGIKPILSRAGRDATKPFDAIHPSDIVKTLPPGCYVGPVDPTTITKEDEPVEEKEVALPVSSVDALPPVDFLLNVFDFEAVARKVMKKEAWDYYSSGADDEITLRENHSAFQRLWLKPRVLVDVKHVDLRTTMLGCDASFPLYITATALAKLANPEGEVVLTRAAHKQGIIQMMPTLASCSLDEMMAARQPGQNQWYQLYVNSNREVTKELIKRAEKGGCKGLFITVDAPQLGRREKDMRNKFTAKEASVQKGHDVNRNQGTARAISAFIDPSLKWSDLAWFKSQTTMPIVLKGVQCGEDAVLAAKHGMAGVVLSNHGGRQLDYARSGIEILPEVMDALKREGLQGKLEVYVDGGVRRGTDIFKALALGAKGVGIGRPTLYGLASYGQEGVERVVNILRDELEMVMRLMGAPTIKDITPDMVLMRNLPDHFVPTPMDHLSSITYETLVPRSRL